MLRDYNGRSARLDRAFSLKRRDAYFELGLVRLYLRSRNVTNDRYREDPTCCDYAFGFEHCPSVKFIKICLMLKDSKTHVVLRFQDVAHRSISAQWPPQVKRT